MKKRNVITIALSALVFKGICISLFANTTNPQMWEFGEIARNILYGKGFQIAANSIDVPSAYMPPGLPYLYFISFSLFGDSKDAYIFILVLNAILASMNVIIIYRIGEIVYDSKIATLSALYTAASPIFIFSSISFNSIIIYQFLIGLSFLFFLKYQSFASDVKNVLGMGRMKYCLYLSLTMGIFLYFRAEILGLVLILFVYIIFYAPKRDAFVLIILAIIVISPWSVRNYLTFGKVIPISTSIGYNFYSGHGDDYSAIDFNRRVYSLKEDSTYETEKSRIGFEEAFKYIEQHPLDEIKETFMKMVSLWFIDKYRENSRNILYVLTWLPTLAFFFFGFARSMKDRNIKMKLIFMNLYLLFSTMLVIVFFNIPRYQIQMSFIMIPTAMYGLSSVYDYFLTKKFGHKRN